MGQLSKQTIFNVQENCTTIGRAIAEQVSPDVPTDILNKLTELSALFALSSHSVALSKKLLHDKEAEVIDAILVSKIELPASILKKKIEGQCSDLMYWNKLAERQNAAISHSIDSLRSCLSYLKQELNN